MEKIGATGTPLSVRLARNLFDEQEEREGLESPGIRQTVPAHTGSAGKLLHAVATSQFAIAMCDELTTIAAHMQQMMQQHVDMMQQMNAYMLRRTAAATSRRASASSSRKPPAAARCRASSARSCRKAESVRGRAVKQPEWQAMCTECTARGSEGRAPQK